MQKFMKKYLTLCLECTYHKAPGDPKQGMLHSIPKVDNPFHTLHADHLGPFVRPRKRNNYLLVIIELNS